ncbi:MAG: isoprenyl transferase [Desulfobulbus propionicus]|nr:MAG: isoprenyl transferase [Desulfobulbus propionicus]
MSATVIIPAHIAIIMDGNGRWAEQRHQPRLFGHRKGVDSVREVVETAREIGVGHLTLYAFSTENWRRPAVEVSGLMGLLKRYLDEELANLLKNDIRLRSLGQRDRLPEDVRGLLEEVITKTAECEGMTLNLALSYGARTEIIEAVQELTRAVARGEQDPEAIDEELFAAKLSTAGQPDPDLLIRTGGEQRLSNFLLWQASYAELYFTDVHWPDFRKAQLLEAVTEFNRRQRRFGRTGAQLTQGPGG